MDHKTWLWRKKSSEKIIVATEKSNIFTRGNEDEIGLPEKAELESDLKILKHKLSFILSDAKNDIAKKHEKMSQDAITGWETTEEEVISLKQRLDEALQQRVAEEERLTHLDAALKECMQQLRFVREEQEHRIHDAVMKTAREFEKSQKILEDKLSEANKRLSKQGIENTQLSRVLLAKEKLIEDLNKQRTQVEIDFDSLTARLELTEKENSSLKYEVRVLEKELEIRSEEREFSRRTANASQKQHLESAKKIAKLESECQRLRILVRKRLPGPAALARMKNEVETMGRDSEEMMRRKMSSSSSSSMVITPDTPSTKINFLSKQLRSAEEENKTLKESLNRKTNELQCSYAHTASKLSQVELQVEELSEGPTPIESTRNNITSHELSLPFMSDIGSDDKISCAESWGSALISELEHFKNGKQKGSPSIYTVGVSDINLMDDFVEMEKLAIISVDKSSGSPHISHDDSNALISSFETESSGRSSEAKGRQIVPVSECQSGNQETKPNNLIGKIPGWLQDIVKLILDQNSVSRRTPDEILEDIRAALEDINDHGLGDVVDRENIERPDASKPTHLVSCISREQIDNSVAADNSSEVTNVGFSVAEKSNQLSRSDFEKSISKIIEIIEGVTPPYQEYGTPETLSHKDGSFSSHKNLKSPSGYVVRVFQWKSSELFAVLHQFIHTCHELLNGKSDVKKFAGGLSSSLEWIMNHCFSLQDVSSMRHEIKEHFDWDEPGSESEEVGQFSEANKLHLPIEQLSCLPMVAASDGNNNFWEKEERPCAMKDENRAAIDGLVNIEPEKKDLEPQSTTDGDELQKNKLQETGKSAVSLQTELGTSKQFKETVEDQKLIGGDLDRQLMVTKDELNEACKKFSSLEMELENKNDCNALNKEEKQLRPDSVITAASEKLAECQEAILNLGKQLKALASPMEVAIFEKIVTTPTDTDTNTTITATDASALVLPSMNKITNQRSTLLDRMLAEDNAKAMTLTSPKASKDNDAAINPLAIVPGKKGAGGSLWKKFLWSKRKVDSRKHVSHWPLSR
ncbi:filament-like plant protein 7 isoform X2 [Tripterygium wilfordii]|uniref:Filament-like plant protein 7 isoform X2 n=1 Tax=Tripterygium wilfordii TaxID=458696 RepID=A0A7J7CQ86_TRIWF|nr:filament-like plant protein 7 [Tripterygium wilfordii]KAF5736168.1 filament-like plant protein 7 isoform X2 [Tripterygium wilfordii]